MNILITGSCGFIGFHLTKHYINKGFNCIGVDNFNNYYDVNLKRNRKNILENYKNFHQLNDDISNNNLFTILKKYNIDLIINLAAQAGVRFSFESPENYFNSNVLGFFNVLNFAKQNNIPLIYASSSSVYGEQPCDDFFHERLNTDNPLSFYAATKKSNEIFAQSFSNMYGCNLIGLRFFTVYGPYGRPDMAYYKFVKAAFDGSEVLIYNNGDHYRDFTYIHDVVLCIDKLSTQILSKKFENEIFNIGNNKPESLINFIKYIEDISGRPLNKKFVEKQNGDVYRTAANINKINNYFNFVPTTTLHEGLTNFISWYKQSFFDNTL